MKTVMVVCVITASAFLGPSVWAGLVHDHVLDQFQENWNVSCDVGGPTMMAQTFRPELDGILCHIEIGVPDFGFNPASAPIVSLYRGQPDTGLTFLTSFTLSSSGYDTGFGNYRILGVPLSGIRVIPNWVYSIVLEADTPGTAWVGAVMDKDLTDSLVPDYYLRGDLWAYDIHTWRLYTAGDPAVYDMQFRTYVVPVPLPAGVWLGICAVGVAGWHLKRQRG